MAIKNVVYTRPKEKYIYQTREPVVGACPECGSSDIKRYPFISRFGPRIAIQCQSCLNQLSVERPSPSDNWPPYQSVTKVGSWPCSRAG